MGSSYIKSITALANFAFFSDIYPIAYIQSDHTTPPNSKTINPVHSRSQKNTKTSILTTRRAPTSISSTRVRNWPSGLITSKRYFGGFGSPVFCPQTPKAPALPGFSHTHQFTLDRVEQWGCHRPLIKPYVRFSRIRLSDILLPSAFSRKYLLVLPAMSIPRPLPHFQACIYVVSSDCTTG